MRLFLASPRENPPFVTGVDKMAASKTCGALSPTLPNYPKKRDSFPKRSETFVIDWGEPKESNLQEAFLKFQKDRQRDVRQTRKMKKKRKLKRNPARLKALRVKFIQQAKKYFGIPYARKYWPKDSPEYNSPMFLDCCALVRQVVRDMRKELGFRIGPWNQAYMYDTLPINLTEDKMKPGDLVFMSGIYTNKKSKKQRHNMTHVEIWLGEGQKTIGARWNNGKVQVFDSYRFKAKSFHSEQYYFKSIDTWLMGVCKSHCPAHPWRRFKYNPGKKSVFNPTSSDFQQNESDEAASGEEADLDTPTSSSLDLDQDRSRSFDSGQSLDRDLLVSDTSAENLTGAVELPLVRSKSSRSDSSALSASTAGLPPILDQDIPEDLMADVEPSLHSYLSSGSESDSDEDSYDRLTSDTDSRQDNLPSVTPAYVVSYLGDSDDDLLDMGINYIHNSKSSGCLSLKPPRPRPTVSSSSLPELDVDNYSFDDVRNTQDNFSVPDVTDTVCTEQESPNLKSPSNEPDHQPKTNLVCVSIPYMVTDNDCFYCIAECNSQTCDFTAVEEELDYDDVRDFQDAGDLDDLDAFDIFSNPSETLLGPEAIQMTESKAEDTADDERCSDSQSRQDFYPKSNVSSLPPESHPDFSTASDKASPKPVDLAVGDADVWRMPPSDADTKETPDGTGETDNSTGNTGNSDSNPSGGDGGGGRRDGGRSPGRGGGKKTPGGKPTKLPTCSLANNMTPSFYIGGGNGVALVEAPLLALGWKRTADKYDERFRLKWVECKSRINYSAFREGDQLVNHIANCQLLTNKMGLLNSLQEYERVTLSTKGRLPRLKMAEFVPETYRLDNRDDRETFLQVYKENEIWISKPTGMNQGKGIFLLRSKDEIEKLLSDRDAKQQQSKPSRPLMSRIVQRYIHNPLLLEERKFDIRAYMLIASTVPYLVLYHKGYIRLSCQKYDGEDTNLTTHLTNQFIQKKVPNYGEVKEDTAWSMDKFNDYINEKVAPEKGVEQNWTYNTLTKQMQRIMLHCFNSVKHKLQCKVGYFDLYGLDFMVDQDMKIWLIEININPCLAINCSALKEVIPDMVQETVYLSLECFEKSRKNQALMPLSSLKRFTILYCGSNPNATARRQTRSVSPAKENNSDKNKSTQSPTIQRRGRSPVRPVPRVAITTTPLTQSPYQPRKSEFSSLLIPQGPVGGNKPSNSAKGTFIYRTNTATVGIKSADSAGNGQTGNSGTDKAIKANSTNKNNSSAGVSVKTSDSKTAAGNTKTGSDSSKSRQGSGGASGNKNTNGAKASTGKVSDKPTTAKSSPSSNTVKVSLSSKVDKTSSSKSEEKAGPSVNGTKVSGLSNGDQASKSVNGNKASASGKNTNKSSTPDKVTASEKDSSVNTINKEESSTKPNSATSSEKSTSESQSTVLNSSTAESKSTEPNSKLDSKLAQEQPKVTTTTSSPSPPRSQNSAEDIKLKMTHATGSASRKNRPRADTGN